MDKSSIATVAEAVRGGTAEVFSSQQEWKAILNTLVQGLAEHLDQTMEVDPAPVCNEHGFSMWVFADESSLGTTWSGVLSGKFRDEKGLDVSFVQFIFDVRQKLRVRKDGSDYIVHLLVLDSDGVRWKHVGWQADDYDEWKDVPFPEEADSS